MSSSRIGSLHCYPLKSAAGIDLQQACLTPTGIAYDRHWMAVTPDGQFLTQRQVPRLALVRPELLPAELVLRASPAAALARDLLAGMGSELRVPLRPQPQQTAATRVVAIWKDRCPAFDAGEQAAAWLTAHLGRPVRLVRFDLTHRRLSNRSWTGSIEASNAFSDGYPLLVIGRASLQELNSRLPQALPMNRFRPNIVLEDIGAYDEDRIDELYTEENVCEPIRLRLVKPCARCRIPSIDQESGELQGEEPLRTLKAYRYDTTLRGALFGQNAVIVQGKHASLCRDQILRIRWKREPGDTVSSDS